MKDAIERIMSAAKWRREQAWCATFEMHRLVDARAGVDTQDAAAEFDVEFRRRKCLTPNEGVLPWSHAQFVPGKFACVEMFGRVDQGWSGWKNAACYPRLIIPDSQAPFRMFWTRQRWASPLLLRRQRRLVQTGLDDAGRDRWRHRAHGRFDRVAGQCQWN